jgi:3-deoxy-D-manno-octulosonic-acid transferase
MSPALLLYRLVTRMLEPLAPRLLDARVKQGKEDPVRVDERLGVTRMARPAGDLVWLHGVSVGETLSLLPVVERIRKARPELTVLVTSGTLTSATLLAQRLPDGVIHQFAPVDAPNAVAAFLDHWKPTLGVFVESELWPNLIADGEGAGRETGLGQRPDHRKDREGLAPVSRRDPPNPVEL